MNFLRPIIFFFGLIGTFVSAALGSPVPTSPTPTPFPTIVTSPTPTIKITNQSPLIDCIGPDGKHLNITQQACDNFNKAWEKPQQQNTSSNSIPVQNNYVDMSQRILINIDDFGGLTKGTFYCYADKVNELSNLQNQIHNDSIIENSCSSVAKTQSSDCANQCSGSSNTSTCIQQCVESSYSSCYDTAKKLGDERRQLSAMVYNDCP